MMEALFATASTGLLEKSQRAGFNQEVGATPYEVVERLGNMRLLRYSRHSNTEQPPVLIVPSLINRFYILDLLPEKSFIAFLAKSFSVYLVDWGEAQDEERELTLEKLMDLHFDFFYSVMLKDCGASKAHLIGQCIGGNLSLIWSLIRPETVASLTMLTTPLDFRVNNKLRIWTQNPDLDLKALIEAYGHAPWPLLQTAFLGLKPMALIQKYRRVLPKINNAKALRSFLALESWSSDNRSVRGACYLDLIELFYRQNCFLEKGFPYQGQRYFLKDLQRPVSALTSLDDHIVPVESNLKKEWVPKAPNVQIWNCEGGHIGGLLGKQSQTEVWPQMITWLQQLETHDITANASKKTAI